MNLIDCLATLRPMSQEMEPFRRQVSASTVQRSIDHHLGDQAKLPLMLHFNQQRILLCAQQ